MTFFSSLPAPKNEVNDPSHTWNKDHKRPPKDLLPDRAEFSIGHVHDRPKSGNHGKQEDEKR